MFMNYYSYILFIPMMIISTIMIFFTSSWFSMWMIMEINMISFISLLTFEKSPKNEMLMNYYLVQTFNSFVFLLSMIFIHFTQFNEILIILMNLVMLTKLGMPPFYMWYLKMMININWINILLMSTIQKIIPLIIINYIMIFKFSIYMNLLLMMLSSMFCSIKGLNQNILKIIMTYSSIIQMTWIITIMLFNETISILYFIIYSTISINLLILFNQFNLLNIINIYLIKFNNKKMFYLMLFSIFSLAGLPPFLGFMMKLISLKLLFSLIPLSTLFIMIMASLISMYFYLQLIFNNIMINSLGYKINYKFINYKYSMNIKLILLNWLSLIFIISFDLF
uniref:NADH-ubiquinone oxidoreductase chain 2 n=1 Tax=Anisopteromalus calandrae TaxID=76800 RepID=A0A8E5N7W2_9HYME|nr:NADH dehydrogenase subunit 2 [Anisopteromalus calandrae]QUX32909.1 NADH dehydrogenase subunit 2 [Anisopteromalus calandrae]